MWEASSIISSESCNFNIANLDGQSETNRPIIDAIDAQYKFFCSTTAKFYLDRNLSGVYSTIMDFYKYHFLDMILPYLGDAVKKDKDSISFGLLNKVA